MSETKPPTGCLGLLFRLFDPGSTKPQQQPIFASESADQPWPYMRKRYLFSQAEFSFFRVLQQAASPTYHVCPKIGMGDLLRLAKGTPDAHSWRNKINRKHIDFVLCDAKTMQPVLCLELDDSSHQQARAQKSDAVKNRALAAAGMPLLRVPVKRGYVIDELQHQIQVTVNASNTAAKGT